MNKETTNTGYINKNKQMNLGNRVQIMGNGFTR